MSEKKQRENIDMDVGHEQVQIGFSLTSGA